LKLSLPLAQDGLASSSPVWTKFRDVIYNNQSKIEFNNWVIIAQSFSVIKGFEDPKFWKVVQSKLREELASNTTSDTVAAVCVAVENCKEISDDLLVVLGEAIIAHEAEIQKSDELNEIV